MTYGYLKATVDELTVSTGLPLEKIQEVLKVIQSFDPPGVGARRLSASASCFNSNAPASKTLWNIRIVNEFMEALGKRRIPEIAARNRPGR
jgi:RNA polymerase sigma-54 factor